MKQQIINIALCLGLLGACASTFANEALEDNERQLRSLLQRLELVAKEDQQDQEDRARSIEEQLKDAQASFGKLSSELNSQKRRYKDLERTLKSTQETGKELEQELVEKTAHLKDLFALTKQVAADAQKELINSQISAQYPNRAERLNFALKSSDFVGSDDIKKLWLSLLEDIVQTGEVTQFDREVADSQGKRSTHTITRIGAFSLLGDDGAYRYDANDNTLIALPDSDQYAVSAHDPENNLITLSIDPTLGKAFQSQAQQLSLFERFEQGGSIAWVIAALGISGLLLVLFKLLSLIVTGSKNRQQIKNTDQLSENNAVGRILLVTKAHLDKPLDNTDSSNSEALENKLNDAIVKEVAELDKGSSLIKLLATVAPLLGLLGTVTGMIETFQSITIFGTNDPRLMAGGISQALVTTVLGLVVAIPLLFGHNAVSSRVKALSSLYAQECLGALARSTGPTPKNSLQDHNA